MPPTTADGQRHRGDRARCRCRPLGTLGAADRGGAEPGAERQQQGGDDEPEHPLAGQQQDPHGRADDHAGQGAEQHQPGQRRGQGAAAAVAQQRAGGGDDVEQQVGRRTAGLGTPSRLTWAGNRNTAPETPTGAVTTAISAPITIPCSAVTQLIARPPRSPRRHGHPPSIPHRRHRQSVGPSRGHRGSQPQAKRGLLHACADPDGPGGGGRAAGRGGTGGGDQERRPGRRRPPVRRSSCCSSTPPRPTRGSATPVAGSTAPARWSARRSW